MATELGIALLGAGTVGAAVARELDVHADRLAHRSGGPLVLRRLAERDPARVRALRLDGVTVGDDAEAAVTDPDVDIVVELLGGLDPAAGLLETALGRGLAAVTANKAVIATTGRRLAAAVRPGSGGLAFEAAVGAAMPVLAMLRDSLQGDEVHSVTAVINGTTNHILRRLEAGDSFDRAVAEAQEKGYAEADPSADLDGHDAAQKLCILAWFAMGADVTPDQVQRRGIRGIEPEDLRAAGGLGAVVRLVARAERSTTGLELTVQPTLVPHPGHPFGDLEGADNAVLVESDLAGRLLLRGRGAGAAAAASAVLSDLVVVARARREGRIVPLPAAVPVRVRDAASSTSGAWLRFRLAEVGVGTAGDARRVLEQAGVTVERTAEGVAEGEIMVLTGPTSRSTLARALGALGAAGAPASAVQAMDRLEPLA
ncbi:MAG: homoserine dehydrogenase [Candidatus Dormibacteria bacterium]|jgi:homoserine dehydrogenase